MKETFKGASHVNSNVKQAREVLDRIKRRRYSRNRRYRLRKVSDHPLTYIEEEIKSDEGDEDDEGS